MVALVATAAAVTLGACTAQGTSSDKEFTGEKKKVADVIEKLAVRTDRGDTDNVCRELLGDPLKAALGGEAGCPASLKRAIDNADYTQLRIDTIDIDAAKTRAVARIKPVEDPDLRRSITLQRAATSAPWLVTVLDPTGKTKLNAGTTPAATTPAETTPASTPATTPKGN